MAGQLKKILIVEDDKFLLRAYKIKLAQAGFKLYAAEDGEKGVQMAKKYLPDLVILDLMLPKLTGFEFLKRVKKDPKTKSIPVIVLSVLGQKTDWEKAMELGAVEYFIKTDYTLDEIIKKINKFLT